MNPLTRLRLLLAQEKTALRTATDDYKVIKARAEQRAIEAGVNGKNADERERNLLVALDEDAAYQTVLITLRQVESDIDRTEAQIESFLDDRRSYEWAIRSALVDALGKAGKDDTTAFEEPLDTAAFDQAMGYQSAEPVFPAGADVGRFYPTDATAEWYGR